MFNIFKKKSNKNSIKQQKIEQYQKENINYQCTLCLNQLHDWQEPNISWICSCCSKHFKGFSEEKKRYRCEEHDFDICSKCILQTQLPQSSGECQDCSNILFYNNSEEKWNCRGCNNQFNGVYNTWRYKCKKHNFSLCRDCLLQQKKKAKQIQQFQQLKLNCICCQNSLTFAKYSGNWSCSYCYNKYPSNFMRFRCEYDDFDICQQCSRKPPLQSHMGNCIICTQKLRYHNKQENWICSYCYNSYEGVQQTQRYRCIKDDFDICGRCIRKPPLQQFQGSCNQCVDKLQYNNQNSQWKCGMCRNKFNSVYSTQRYSCYTHGFNLCGMCSVKSEEKLIQQQKLLKEYEIQKIQQQQQIQQQQEQQQQHNNNEQQNQTEKKIKQLAVDDKMVDNKLQCKICMDKQSCFLNPMCGHLSVCEDCVQGLKNQCPICRKEGQFIKVFI